MMRHPLIFRLELGENNKIMEKTQRPNRIREALGQLPDQQPSYFQQYLRRFQEDPTSRVFAPLAEAYRRLARYDEAITVCQEGLRHHPDFHGGRIVLAKCFLAKKLLAEAKGELERVIHSVPENLLAQRLLGDTHSQLGNAASALHCYKMALLLAPNDVTLAEKVHALENGLQTAPAQSPESLPLPHTLEEFEEEIPPLWASEEGSPGVADASEEAPFGLQPLPLEEDVIDDEAFKIEHVSSIFEETEGPSSKEITTETLGDLYFSQGQFDKALRIFEKLKPTQSLARKINECRSRLGVDMESMVRARKVALLRAVIQVAKGRTS